MALADSSENAILDLSKKINKREPDNKTETSMEISNFISNSISYPLDQFKMFMAQPINIMLDSKYKLNDQEEADGSISPNFQLYNRMTIGNIQSQNSFPTMSDMHSFRENMSATSMLSPNEQDATNMRMRTLPHRKRPIALLNSTENCDDFTIKMMKTSYPDEVCSFASDKNDDRQSLGSSRSPELLSPITTPDNVASISNLDDKSHSPSESDQVKSTSRVHGGQLKDEAYWERRRKNNEAAKRSRDTRKQKEEETAHKARSLAQENISLRAEINILRTQLCNMQSMLFYRNNPPSHM